VLSLAAGFVTAAAQEAVPADGEARFEVASIRKTDLASFVGSGKVPPIGVRTLPNGLNATMATPRMLIMSAYQLKDYQLVGGPSWVDSDRFDISARAAGNATPQAARLMLQNLLKDRFMLRVHAETRQADVHSLVLARTDGRLGPRLQRTSPECEATLEARKSGGTAPPSERPDFEAMRKQTVCGMSLMGSTAAGAAYYSLSAVPLDRLLNQVSGEVRGPVVDRTGLTGLFDVLLEFASQARQLQAAPQNAPDLTKDVALPTLRDALQEQLGLKLETGKGPMDVLVIDSIERPSDN
jgi:uncharacterized protein (TIGR03435 family)